MGIIPSPYVQAKGSKGYPRYDKYDLSLFDLTGRQRQAEYSASSFVLLSGTGLSIVLWKMTGCLG